MIVYRQHKGVKLDVFFTEPVLQLRRTMYVYVAGCRHIMQIACAMKLAYCSIWLLLVCQQRRRFCIIYPRCITKYVISNQAPIIRSRPNCARFHHYAPLSRTLEVECNAQRVFTSGNARLNCEN